MKKPETLTAILPSFGYGPGFPVWTRHTYLESRECVVQDADDPSQYVPAIEHIFKCDDTGAERRWGVDEVSDIAQA